MKDDLLDAAINNGSYKQALTQVQRRIKQHPNSSYFYAVKAQVLALQGERVQALKEAQQLTAQCPSDPDTLKRLVQVFDLCDYEPEKGVFEEACKKYPSSELVYQWFVHSVRTGDIVQVQKSTMLLTRAVCKTPRTPEYTRMLKFWAAMGFLLVSKCTTLAGSSAKLFPMLGLKMAQQALPSSAQEHYVTCQLLELVGKDEECLDQLEHFLEKENDLELKLMYMRLLKKTPNHEKLFAVCSHYLVDLKEDDWDTWKLAIEAAAKCDQLPKCIELIGSYPQGRNRDLAYLQMAKAAPEVSFDKHFRHYLAQYGSKKCCFPDLKEFLHVENIKPALDDLFGSKIKPILDGKHKPSESDQILMVNYLKLKLALDPEILKSRDFLAQACQFFSVTKPLLKELQEFDFSASFEFVVMACDSLVVQQSEPLDEDLLLRLVVILESAVRANPYEFHLKLWLISVYLKLNLVSRAEAHLDTLKLKFVQLDTLGPVLGTRYSTLTRNGHFLEGISALYTKNLVNEVPHMILNGFQKLALSKIEGFFEFELRLKFSLTRYLNTVNRLRQYRLQNKDADSSFKDELRQFWKVYRQKSSDVGHKISDNRDTRTFWDCAVHEEIPAVAEQLCHINPEVDLDYLAVMVLQNLVVYDTQSVLYDEYKQSFLEKYARVDEFPLTSAEKWSLSCTAHVLDSSVPVRPSPVLPESTLHFEFNHTRLVVEDTVRQLKQMRQPSKDAEAVLKTLSEDLGSVKKKSRKDIAKAEDRTRKWFKTDEVGQLFEIDQKAVGRVFEEIRQSAQKDVI